MEMRWNSLCDPPDRTATSIMIQGLTLKFHRPPPLRWSTDPPPDVVTCLNKAPVLIPFIMDWLKRGILLKLTKPRLVFFSRMFYVSKKNGKFRPIIDLSVLNRYIVTPSFKMETLQKILPLIFQVLWATSLDVTDAFLSVPIHPDLQIYFVFVLDGIVYMFQKMPFGLTTAPWLFTRVMKPVKKFLRGKGVSLSSFLDDFLILAITKALAELHTSWTQRLLEWLGFSINLEKSSVIPLQRIEYLGLLLNLRTLTLALPAEKVQSLLSRCQTSFSSSEMTRRELERLVGFLNFAAPSLEYGRLHLVQIINWMNSHTSPSSRDLPVPLDAGLKRALLPFLDRKFLQTPVSFRPPVPDLDISTDASDYGWSGVLHPFRIQDSWTPSDLSNSINWREMKAILNTLRFCRRSLYGKVLRIHTDNLATLFCIKKMGSTHSPPLNKLSRELLLFCQLHKITLVPVYIPGVLNVLADQGSRKGPIITEWSLDPDSFLWIFQVFNIFPKVDLFATKENTKFASYVSPSQDPEAYAQDALSLNWDDHWSCIYLFPPPSLMPLVLEKIVAYKGTGILIAPFRESDSWRPILEKRARSITPLPQEYYLFQSQFQEIFFRKFQPWNLHVWIL